MARSNGSHPAGPGSRRRLIQPVLPALPLIPRVKKESIKIQEEESSGVNKSTPEPHGAAEISTGPGPGMPTTIEEAVHKEDIDAGTAVPKEADDIAEMTDLVTKESDVIAQAASELKVPTHDRDNAPFQDTDTIVPATQSFAEDNGQIDELSGTPVSAVEPLIPLAEDTAQDDSVKTEPHGFDIDGPISPNGAPEAVTGDVEKLLNAQHFPQYSMSIASVQHTPRHSIVVPISPEEVRASHQPIVANGVGTTSASPGFINGHVSPTNHAGTASGSIISPKGQQGFPTILDHICNLQYTLDGYDCDLHVYYSQSSKPSIYRNAHSLVLVRSERLRSFIYPQRAASYTYYVINFAPARPIDANAFDAALKFLYADTVLSADRFFHPYTVMDKAARVGALDYIMSYMVAGLELGLEPVVTRALDIIGRFLDWDIAELAAKEAYVLRPALTPSVGPHAPPEASLAAKSLLQHVFNLIVLRLDVKQFNLDTESVPTHMKSRLSQFETGRAAINPALANMVFGSMPASADISPASPQFPGQAVNSPDSIASTIMLNLDFEDLGALAQGLKSVHGSEGTRIVSQVVEERERRRLEILNDRSISNKQRTANSAAWDVIGLREYVLDASVRRERIGYLQTNK